MSDTTLAEPNLKCSYPIPCIGMDNHSRGPESGKHAGIFALSSRCVVSDPKVRMFHMGFVLKGSPDERVGKAGVMLNFCPWCGSDLMQWLEAYQSDIAAHKSTLALVKRIQACETTAEIKAIGAELAADWAEHV